MISPKKEKHMKNKNVSILTFGVILLFTAPLSIAQKVDVYSRPLQRERSRDFDAVHYRVELRFDEGKKSFWGKNTITLSPLRDDFQKCTLDAEGYSVTSVVDQDSKHQEFRQTGDKLIIRLSKAHDYGDTVSLTVSYQRENAGPDDRASGIRFIDESPDNPPMIIAGSAPRWFPCYHYPNDKATHEIIVTVPHEYKALSNGRLVGVTEDRKAGTKTFHWSQDLPHPTQQSMMAAGPFVVLEDSLGSLPVNYWVWEQDAGNALRSVHRTPEMIEFFSKEYGYDYPWAKYDQITLPGGGGSEYTSATRLGQTAIHDERAEQDYSSHGWLICHELAHQWWGNLVTCRDWSHTWINESFGTYSEVMFALYDGGEEEAALNVLGKKNQYFQEARTRYMRPIVFDRWESPGQNFDRHTYQKGAVIVHLMRWILGEKPFHKTLSHFLHEHAFESVDTHDFLTAVKEATGQNLDWFFDQWLLSPGHPVFDVGYDWNEEAKRLTWRITQTQDTSAGIPIFNTPVILAVITPDGKRSEKVWLEERIEEFEFDCDQKPLMVRFDEGNHLLKEWTFKKSVDELIYQLNEDDVIGRMWAASQLGEFDDDPRVAAELIKRAEEDPFWAVRRDALYILGGYRGVVQVDLDRGNIPWSRLNTGFQPGGFLREDFIDFFRKAAEDENSKVRAAAIWAMGNLGKKTLVPYFKHRFEKDDSYRAQAAALIAIGKSGGRSDIPFLEKAARIQSPKNLEDHYTSGILKRAADWALRELR